MFKVSFSWCDVLRRHIINLDLPPTTVPVRLGSQRKWRGTITWAEPMTSTRVEFYDVYLAHTDTGLGARLI